MKFLLSRPSATSWLLAPALVCGLLLSSCNSQPTATETEKTATVVSSDMTETSDSAATVAPATDTTGTAPQ